MDDRRKTLAAITLIIGLLVIVAVIVGIVVSGKKIVSPVPDDASAIKIIFVTPTPQPKADQPLAGTPTPTDTLSPTKKTTPKPTVKPTATPTSTSSATPTP
jgi:hypothetical protein